MSATLLLPHEPDAVVRCPSWVAVRVEDMTPVPARAASVASSRVSVRPITLPRKPIALCTTDAVEAEMVATRLCGQDLFSPDPGNGKVLAVSREICPMIGLLMACLHLCGERPSDTIVGAIMQTQIGTPVGHRDLSRAMRIATLRRDRLIVAGSAFAGPAYLIGEAVDAATSSAWYRLRAYAVVLHAVREGRVQGHDEEIAREHLARCAMPKEFYGELICVMRDRIMILEPEADALRCVTA